MAAKSKTVQPDNVLRSVFKQGVKEMRDAGMIVRVGNTDKHGGGLVLSVPAWRYCGCCEGVVTVPEYDNDMGRCRMCASTGTEAQAVPEGQP